MTQTPQTPVFPQQTGESNATPQEAPVTVRISMPHTKPYVTYTIMALTIVIYLLQMFSQQITGTDLPAMYGMKINQLIVEYGQYWRLLTPMLLHGSIMHIVVNMYALNAFGPGLEMHFGHWRYLALYILSGFAGNVFSFIFTPANSLGSSTAIFGLLAAEGVFLYQNRKIFGSQARRALTNIVMVGLVNLIIGLSPGIDNWGHIGGLLGGMAFTWFGGPLLRVQGVVPALSLVDEREPSDVYRAGIMVGAFFFTLAAVLIYLRGY
jgi:rhomboid protease GluP